MLMKRLREGYRDITAQFASPEPVAAIASRRPAANASSFVKAEKKTKHHGRLRRLNRGLTHNSRGWTVRTW